MSLARRWVEQVREFHARERAVRREAFISRPKFCLADGLPIANVDDDGRLELFTSTGTRIEERDALRFGQWLVATYGPEEELEPSENGRTE